MSNQVEDFTKQGLEDLRNGVIRTPLEPYKTFLDDPLRILRTFRFASRFGFQVEKNIVEVLKSDEILVFFFRKYVFFNKIIDFL